MERTRLEAAHGDDLAAGAVHALHAQQHFLPLGLEQSDQEGNDIGRHVEVPLAGGRIRARWRRQCRRVLRGDEAEHLPAVRSVARGIANELRNAIPEEDLHVEERERVLLLDLGAGAMERRLVGRRTQLALRVDVVRPRYLDVHLSKFVDVLRQRERVRAIGGRCRVDGDLLVAEDAGLVELLLLDIGGHGRADYRLGASLRRRRKLQELLGHPIVGESPYE